MIRLLPGDCRDILPTLEPESIQACVCSPPYYGLRDYQIAPSVWGGDSACGHQWGDECPGDNRGGSGTPNGRNNRGELYGRDKGRGGFCQLCGAWRGCLGLEPTLFLYIEHLVEIFELVKRVLRKDGTCWVNIGSSYVSKPCGPLKPKDDALIPFRLAIALQEAGWWVRSDIIWAKPNPMPESTKDRPTKSHEYVFLLSKSERYFWDQEAVREPYARTYKDGPGFGGFANRQQIKYAVIGNQGSGPQALVGAGANLRSVWTIPTQPFSEAHFATFPPALVEKCIRAGTSEMGACSACGTPWVRVLERTKGTPASYNGSTFTTGKTHSAQSALASVGKGERTVSQQTIGWKAQCRCDAPVVPCVVLDPFAGSGTTGLVAQRLGRDAILIDASPMYTAMAKNRIIDDAHLLARVVEEPPHV